MSQNKVRKIKDLGTTNSLGSANCPELPTETWKPIPGFEGYEVSGHGRVRSFRKQCGFGLWTISDKPQRILSLAKRPSGYQFVALMSEDQRNVINVHKLVMLAFVGPCPDGMEICHNDGDPSNNHLSNLRYDTHQANMHDAIKHGTLPGLPPEEVVKIRKSFVSGKPRQALAKAYNVRPETISNLIRGATYTELDGPIVKSPDRPDIETVKAIREEFDQGIHTRQELVKKYKLKRTAIQNIINGKTYKDAGGPTQDVDFTGRWLS